MVEVSPNEAVELASTAEVMDLFSSYCEADSESDIADARASSTPVVTNGVDTSLDFKSKALDPHYVSQPAPSRLEHFQGDHIGALDVSQLVAEGCGVVGNLILPAVAHIAGCGVTLPKYT
ncbi:hypothetical protein ABBQ32_000624 [Trebouxia sp. C0010 RCD-2024]